MYYDRTTLEKYNLDSSDWQVLEREKRMNIWRDPGYRERMSTRVLYVLQQTLNLTEKMKNIIRLKLKYNRMFQGKSDMLSLSDYHQKNRTRQALKEWIHHGDD